MRMYLGLSRYWYNRGIEYSRKDGTSASMGELRALQYGENPDWSLDCPQRIREHALADACKAVKNAKSKFKRTGIFQEIKFRKKKDNVQGFGFDRQSLKSDFVFNEKTRKLVFHASEDIQGEKEGCRIVRENNRYFVIIPSVKRIKVPDNQRFGDVAIDPGVRTFATIFSENIVGKIGCGDFQHVYRLCLGLDRLYSKMSKAKCKAKRNMRRSSERLRWRIRDLVDDMHKKLAHFLVTTFDRVFIPVFESSRMVSKLRSKTARSMLTFGHYRFKQYLKSKGEEYSCDVVEVSEAYTSRTCSYCGRVHVIGSKRDMVCECGVTEDRDINGARGIYLRALSAMTPLKAGNC